MVVKLDDPRKAVTYTFTDEEWSVLTWIRQRHGADAEEDLMKNWLRSMWEQKEDIRLDSLKTAVPPELDKRRT